ncbi:hypothetical protein J416_01949 [Gracilibacillus halophilus YIM-C55.5]|uniref:DUF1659 domain-containing protein n=1 Tax=Gracilibacillus halophilus YIM-C55.5 TaxID=1308866 RepID=N4WCV2_9BACI|nr:DUF1659 domain-containing protein [Gracilibacillus halophilus]ENH98088.1 hypothetical protein J416_01949 [Gracilibacillus halophilus YIM-C55.5]
MAVTERTNSRLQLVFENGVDPVSGDTVYATRSFNNVKLDATADQLFAITEVLTPLQNRTLNKIERDDTELIMADE